MKEWEERKLGPAPGDSPENNEAIRMIVNAWHELDGDRHIGFDGQGSIPFTALVTWAEVNKLDDEAFVLLRLVIRQLDNERALREASKRKTAKGSKK